MVVLNDKTAEIYIAIRSVIRDFYTRTLRDVVKNRGIDLDAPNNADARTALAYMRDVSENPQKYFSRAATEHNWNLRAIEYTRNKKSPLVDAYGSKHIVDDPADIVYKNVFPCIMDEEIARNYRDFCKVVMNWEYCRTSADYNEKHLAIAQQQRIYDTSRQVSELSKTRFGFDGRINALYGGKRR